MKKPVAFMSYAHWDDEDRRLTKLRERLSHAVRMRTGKDFEIFQDSEVIQVGEKWKRRIEESLNEAIFLIPVITPSFFNSQYCRDELRRFLTREKKLGRDDLILPVYYIDTPLLNDEARRKSDELTQVIATHQ